MMQKVKKMPHIDKEACAGCSICLVNCPMECISITDPAFHGDIRTIAQVDASTCIGCGICAKSCPIQAIEMVERKVAKPMKTKTDMRKIAYRGVQQGFKVAMRILPWRMPELIQGVDAVKRLPALVKRRGFKKVLIVTDENLMRLHLLDDLLKEMENLRLDYVIYREVAANPTDFNVEEGLNLYLVCQCDCMIAFGGGAPMDCAKAIGACVARPRKRVSQLQGLLKVLRPIPTIFAVPTTSGTGSETTMAAVITENATHHKASINDLCLIPKYAVLDPKLTVGLPPRTTATTGMDALCHAVEAYTNHVYNSDLENDMARQAVKLIYENLYKVYTDGSNLSGRQNMQLAAFYAGRAFTRGCVGYVHAIGHTLGGLYGVPHGLAMSIILPHVMRAFGPAVYERLAELSDVCGMTDSNASKQEKAEAFIRWIEEMKVKMEIPEFATMIQEDDVDQMVEWVDKEANPVYPVPVIWSKAEIKSFIMSIR